jgi:two-component system, chemotaxis family, chemotaxis protein CheY
VSGLNNQTLMKTTVSRSFSGLPFGTPETNHTPAPTIDCSQSWDAPDVQEEFGRAGGRERWMGQEAAQNGIEVPESRVGAGSRKAKVLIVDDVLVVREAMAKVLRDQGYEVILAADGREALERLQGQRTDLVLLDLNKPVKNCWNTFEEVLSLNPMQSVILLAERCSAGEWEITGHPTWLVEKPVCLPVMLDSVKRALAESASCHICDSPGEHSSPRPIKPRQASAASLDRCEYWDHYGIND